MTSVWIPTPIYNAYFNSHPHKGDDVLPSIYFIQRASFQFTSPQRGWRNDLVAKSVALPFQFTSPQRGWRPGNPNFSGVELFQFTSPQRGWPKKSLWTERHKDFNSHPHKGDDIVGLAYGITAAQFQFTSPQRGWLYIAQTCTCIFVFQFTSPQRGWRENVTPDAVWRLFQFTSPQRGWPQKIEGEEKRWNFNSHPHKGDDESLSGSLGGVSYFNSHPHKGDDKIRC
mgnify:CR=1 FL=1